MRWLGGDWSSIFMVIGRWLVVIEGDWCGWCAWPPCVSPEKSWKLEEAKTKKIGLIWMFIILKARNTFELATIRETNSPRVATRKAALLEFDDNDVSWPTPRIHAFRFWALYNFTTTTFLDQRHEFLHSGFDLSRNNHFASCLLCFMFWQLTNKSTP